MKNVIGQARYFTLCALSPSTWSSRHHWCRWTLHGQMSSTSTIIADYDLQAFFAFVATLVTIMTNHITRIKSRCRPSERRRGGAAQRTIPCNMTWLATDIAHRTIDTISCQMSRLTTIIARFLVGAVHSKMSWSITIVAQPCFGNPSFLHNTTLG